MQLHSNARPTFGLRYGADPLAAPPHELDGHKGFFVQVSPARASKQGEGAEIPIRWLQSARPGGTP